MRRSVIVAAALSLVGCSRPAQEDQFAGPHGRYLGVGVYSAGQLWSRMASKAPAAPETATSADDEHVIVVVDSRTGELRECGDYSGLCVSMHPWAKAVAPAQTSPVSLTKHLPELQREEQDAGRRASGKL